MAPLAWVPWVPGNPSIFEQWVAEPINFGDKGPKYTPFLIHRAGDKGLSPRNSFWNLST